MGDKRGRGGDEAPGHRLDAEPRPRPNNHPQGNKPRRCRPVTEEGPPGAATGPPPPPDDATPPTQSRRGGPDPLSLSKTPPKPPTPPPRPSPHPRPRPPSRHGGRGGGCGGKRGTSGQGRARMGERRPGRRGAGPGPEAWGAVGEESTRSGRAEVRADIRRTGREPSRAGGGTRRTTAGAPREPRLRGPPGRGGPDPGKAPRGPAAAPPRPETRRGHRAGGGAATGDDRRRRRWQGGTRPPQTLYPPSAGKAGRGRAETEDKARQGAAGGHGSSGGPGRGRWGAEPGRDNKGVGRGRLKGGEDGHRAQPLPRRCTTPPFLRATAARSATPRAAVAALPRASGRPLPLFSLSPAHTRFFSRPSRPAGRHRAGPPAPHG